MKKIPLVTAFLFLLFQATAQQNEKYAVKECLLQMFGAMTTRNVPVLRKYTTKDMLILEDGHLFPIDSVIAGMTRLKTLRSFRRVNNINIVSIRIEGGSAWLAFTDISEITIAGRQTTENCLESAYLVKQNNGWKVQMIHSTTINLPHRHDF